MKILLVEDDPDLSRALSRTLEKRGYTVTPCFDGIEAFRLIRQGGPLLSGSFQDETAPSQF